MTLHCRIRRATENMGQGGALAIGIFLTALWAVVLVIVGSPRTLLLLLSRRVAILPSWLFLLLSFVFYFVAGFSAGGMLFWRCRTDEVAKFRGAFFFTLAITASYLWYALFFGARFFLPAFLLMGITAAGLTVAALNARRISQLLAAGLWGCVGWAGYCLLLNLVCFFAF